MTAATVLGVRVDGTALDECLHVIADRVRTRQGAFVCACNVHMIMEAKTLPELRQALASADLVLADGAPLSWSLRARGLRAARVAGTELAMAVIEKCVEQGWSIGLIGSTPTTLAALVDSLRKSYPALRIACAVSPPFGGVAELSASDESKRVLRSGADVLLVGLGCPKQEIWMSRHVGGTTSVMLGVGATFDFLAGTVRRAPRWMQRVGCEWLFRLAQEPRRLLGRYIRHNPRFAVMAAIEIMHAGVRRCGAIFQP